MFHKAPDWRVALVHALQSALRIEASADSAPYELAKLPAAKLLALDEALRRAYWKATAPGPAPAEQAQALQVEYDALLFCMGCKSDGHLRERALRLMHGRTGMLPFALALIRSDDWVPQVRAIAEETLRACIDTTPTLLFAHLDLVLKLRGRQRFETGAWPALLAPVLSASTHRQYRWELLKSSNVKSRLFAAQLILQAEPEHAAALASNALAGSDPILANWALRTLPASIGWVHSPAMLAPALRHRHASVRANALRAYGRAPDTAYAAVVRDALFDPSVSVRNVAVYAARELGIDSQALYREALDRGESSRARYALLALAERAEREDLPRLSPWLRHPAGDVRAAALKGSLRAGVDDPAVLLREALTASSKVAAFALKLGRTVPGFMTRATLSEAFARSANATTRRHLLDATRRIDRWSALECLLDCADCAPGNADVEVSMRGWLRETGQRYARLSDVRRRDILERIELMSLTHPNIDWATMRSILAHA